MEPSDHQRFLHSPEVITQHVSGETVLLDLESETYFGLNDTGTRIWQLLGDDLSVEQVVARLQNEFDVSQDVLREDCAELIEMLLDAGLIEPRGHE